MTSVLGRHEFLVRRLHSLLGLVPIGGYLAFHMATNAAIWDGLPTYQTRADQIHAMGETTIWALGWSLIFLPILFHGLIGLMIVHRGERNLSRYPYSGNIRYTLQRTTGVIAFAFILWHVFQMHGWFHAEWWTRHVAGPLGGGRFDPENVATAIETIQSAWWIPVAYAVGTLVCIYHLANGVWTMGITWGVWTSPNAQRWANVPCAALGVSLVILSAGALVGMLRVDVSETGAPPGDPPAAESGTLADVPGARSPAG